MEKIIQISSGRGPAECCWVVAQLLKIIIEQAQKAKLKYEVIDREEGPESRTLASATLLLKGEKTSAFIKEWEGSVQWIGKSAFRKFHKRKNWFVSVKEIEVMDSEYELKESDLKYETMRSSGPGGQHVNKVSTAIRIIHKPSGITATASDTRSQLQNRKFALKRLELLLLEKQKEKVQLVAKASWQNHNELERGNPVKVFEGSDFKSIKKVKNYKSARQSLKEELRNRQDE